MDEPLTQEQIKPFRLFKYFSITSLVVIFIGTMVLSFLNTQWAKTLQNTKREEFARLLVENLNHQVFTQFVIPVALQYGKIQLREPEQFERMDKVVRNTLYSFKVQMVNIYDTNNTISYSFDPEMVGKSDVGGENYDKAVAGQLNSTLVQQGTFLEILLGFPKAGMMQTFAPLRAERPLSSITGPVLGVVEIVQDLSEDYQTIFRSQVVVIITCAVVMGVLFVVLILVVRRGERIMESRAQERLRLKEQLSRAERLSSLGEMAAGISHEIRNPLGIIRSSAELLKKKMERIDPTNAFPDIIVEESTRLNNIINDFIKFARPGEPNLVPCRVEDVVEKNALFLAPHMEKKGYILNTRIADELPEIIADSDMLYQAFLNILLNAMQAMPDGGIVQIAIDSADGMVRIQFDDEGEGVKQDIIDKIWDPFFTTKETGTGLGLGLVKNIVESHGGVVRIENRPVRGARITVQLPIRKEI